MQVACGCGEHAGIGKLSFDACRHLGSVDMVVRLVVLVTAALLKQRGRALDTRPDVVAGNVDELCRQLRRVGGLASVPHGTRLLIGTNAYPGGILTGIRCRSCKATGRHIIRVAAQLMLTAMQGLGPEQRCPVAEAHETACDCAKWLWDAIGIYHRATPIHGPSNTLWQVNRQCTCRSDECRQFIRQRLPDGGHAGAGPCFPVTDAFVDTLNDYIDQLDWCPLRQFSHADVCAWPDHGIPIVVDGIVVRETTRTKSPFLPPPDLYGDNECVARAFAALFCLIEFPDVDGDGIRIKSRIDAVGLVPGQLTSVLQLNDPGVSSPIQLREIDEWPIESSGTYLIVVTQHHDGDDGDQVPTRHVWLMLRTRGGALLLALDNKHVTVAREVDLASAAALCACLARCDGVVTSVDVVYRAVYQLHYGADRMPCGTRAVLLQYDHPWADWPANLASSSSPPIKRRRRDRDIVSY